MRKKWLAVICAVTLMGASVGGYWYFGKTEEVQASVVLADGATEIDGDGVSVESDEVTITKSGTYHLSGTLTNGRIIIDVPSGSAVLVLDDVNISNDNKNVIYSKSDTKVTITAEKGSKNTLTSGSVGYEIEDSQLSEDGTVKGSMKATVYVKGDLAIEGSGQIDVNGYIYNGIQSKGELSLKQVKLDVTSKNHAVKAGTDLLLSSGTYTIDSEGDAFHADSNMTIKDGTYKINSKDDGMDATGELVVDGGTITIESCVEGLEAHEITINDGDISVTSSDDGFNANGGKSGFGGNPSNGGDHMHGNFADKISSMTDEEVTNMLTKFGLSEEEAKEFVEKRESMSEEEIQEFLKDNMDTSAFGKNKDTSKKSESDSTSDGQNTGAQSDTTKETSSSSGEETDVSDGNNSEMPNGERPDFGDGNMPEMPNGERPDFGDGNMPEMPNGERPDFGDGNMPEMPDGEKTDADSSNSSSEEDTETNNGIDLTTTPELTINGGTIYINSEGDGIDSNGNITINGGDIYVDGPSNGGNSAIDYASENQATMVVNGGNIVAIGYSSMVEDIDEASKQASLIHVFDNKLSAGEEIKVTDSDGKEITTFTLKKNADSVILSNSSLKEGESYSFSYAGTKETVTMDSISTSNATGMGFGFWNGQKGTKETNNSDKTTGTQKTETNNSDKATGTQKTETNTEA